MPRSGGEIKCPICFELLFNSLDDLDEALPAVVTECGHGFHKPCIEQWFKSQAEAYVEMMAPRQSDYDEPITTADAPALCPSCREECYANPETGEVGLIKLFFASEDRMDGSSQMAGSSPVRPMPKTDKAASGELMGLARRAKTIAADVAGFECETDKRHVDGMLDRAEALSHDVASAKAIQAVKRYIGGLTSAINTFRSQLKESPLPAMLRVELERAKQDAETAKQEARVIRAREVAPQIKQLETANHELKISQKKVKRLTDDLDETKNRLKEVQTTSAAQMKNWREGYEQMKVERNKATERAAQAEEDARARTQDLNERTRQLKSYKAKNTELRTRYEEMEKENKRLQRELKDLQVPIRAVESKRSDDGSNTDVYEDGPDAASSPSRSTSMAAPVKPRIKRTCLEADVGDESLSVDMPSFEDSNRYRGSSSLSPVRPAAGPSRVRQHPTARTFRFGTGSEMSLTPRKKSKYFPEAQNKLSSGLSGELTSDLTALSDSDHEKDNDQPRIIIPATSSPHRPLDASRSRTNPFQTTRQESVAKTDAKFKRKPMETIEIEDSTDGDSPLRPANLNTNVSSSNTSVGGQGKKTSSSLPGKTPSMAAYLGLTDRTGRPLKSVASGSKVKRRA